MSHHLPSSVFTFKLSFFVLRGSTVVDGQTEAAIDVDALKTQLTALGVTDIQVKNVHARDSS